MRRLLVAVMLLALGSSAASAQEAPAPRPARIVPLSELTTIIEVKLAAVRGLGEAPGADRAAIRRADVAGLTVLIGRLRIEADRTLRASLSQEAAEVVKALPADADAPTIARSIESAGLDAVETWLAERIAPDWLEFAGALAELRSVEAALGPLRVCPVLGENWFTDNWGDDRPGARSHKGIDMMGKRGIPVRAIEDGVVVQANWHRQGGRQIYVRADSTGDVYYYAHLDYWEKWIWTGTRVQAGDVMGRLGSSGNASSPHLHFGWMPGSARIDLLNLQNPYPMLLEICPDNVVPEWFLAAQG